MLVFLIGIAAILLGFWKLDNSWISYYPQHLQGIRSLKKVCTKLGIYGEFQYYNLIVFLLILGIAHFRKSRYLRQLAIASFMSGLIAGSAALATKNILGRPRPQAIFSGYETNPVVFRGPMNKQKLKAMAVKHVDPKDPPRASWWQSFPSGHSAATIGAALPVLIAVPAIGIPVFLVGASITLSRLFGGYHHPSDILASLTLAVTVGTVFGLRLRRIAKRGRSLNSKLHPH